MPNIRTALLETLGRHGAMSLEELAQVSGKSKMSLRYHLGLLARQGMITVCRDPRHDGVGRPQALIALTGCACELLPKHYDRLAVDLLDELNAQAGPGRTRRLLRGLGRHAAAAMRPQARLVPRLNRAAKVLTARGYMASWAKKGDGYSIWLGNCPYRQVVNVHPEICEMDLAMVEAMVEGAASGVRCVQNGEARCEFVILARPANHE